MSLLAARTDHATPLPPLHPSYFDKPPLTSSQEMVIMPDDNPEVPTAHFESGDAFSEEGTLTQVRLHPPSYSPSRASRQRCNQHRLLTLIHVGRARHSCVDGQFLVPVPWHREACRGQVAGGRFHVRGCGGEKAAVGDPGCACEGGGVAAVNWGGVVGGSCMQILDVGDGCLTPRRMFF